MNFHCKISFFLISFPLFSSLSCFRPLFFSFLRLVEEMKKSQKEGFESISSSLKDGLLVLQEEGFFSLLSFFLFFFFLSFFFLFFNH